MNWIGEYPNFVANSAAALGLTIRLLFSRSHKYCLEIPISFANSVCVISSHLRIDSIYEEKIITSVLADLRLDIFILKTLFI